MKFKTDFEKQVLLHNFEKRNWTKTNDDDWNFYWASVWSVRSIFNPDSGIRLFDNQIINHFPNYFEISRKDLMVKNIKRYRKELEKEGSELCAKDESGNYIHLDIIPLTYILPGDYNIFIEEYKRQNCCKFICKPIGKSQGKGIFIVKKLNQLKKWSGSKGNPFNGLSMKDSYVISKYLDKPLLVMGKKFDIRLYVLVTSYRPLKIWIYDLGFARFCVEDYDNDDEDITCHLTNNAIQKHMDNYDDKHGSKVTLQSLYLYIEMTKGKAAIDRVIEETNNVIIQSLKALQNVIINDRHCFEVYGYDLLVDENFKIWLIEVNSSPSLSTTGEADRQTKTFMINDTLNVVMPKEWNKEGNNKFGANLCKEKKVGYYRCIYDEQNLYDDKKKGKKGSGWK